jgi:hypothetical protein
MNDEMYAQVGGKALPKPKDNMKAVKVINFVNEEGQPVGKAAHVDPSSGTVTQVVNALIAAGLMASA